MVGLKMARSLQHAAVHGQGSVHEGEYEKVTIHGMGHIVGPVKTGEASFQGDVRVKAHLTFSKMKTAGRCSCHGELDGEEMHVHGDTTLHGEVRVRHVKASGKLQVDRGIRGELVQAQGVLHIAGGIECERIELKGSVHVPGLLNASHVSIMFDENSMIEEIGGEHIRIMYDEKKGWFGRKRLRDVKLKANSIEGNHVTLEHTHARIVRGEDVVIGPNCQIELVEYSRSLEISSEASVKHQEKIQL